ncbi:hypothetical protein [Acetobacter lovaniensis]|uniref:Uncharacterized protein n=1 Tax=Acetobacter lovaniensis TaxID=104100 RepID=A0A841QI46_9PROT|nr:hypothetical protein [Acetobacter lovaniensis]MBB6457995.1 hypothetical protein [Acetobacter lovaniensis]NHN82252.1 hypothetical protein [Acetobacter lovaniensis]GBQ72876.1 hypothetical protein AA0474_2806 [Acetobacter lovaniensis NRIC 0474]
MSETLTDTTQDTPSTQLAPDTESVAVGGGAPQQDAPEPEKPAEPEAPKSRRAAIEAAANKLEKEDGVESGKPADKPHETVKPKPDTQADKVEETAGGQDGEKPEGEPKPDGKPEADDRKQPQAPKRFLPKAKETWANTPNSVKAEVARLERDYEAAVQRSSENQQFRESLKPFEDFAERNGIKLSQALEVYTDLDRLLKQNPVQAVGDILQRIGMRPDQYAQMVLQNSPEYQAHMMMPRIQAQPQQAQVSPREQQLQQQLAQEQAARVSAEVIAPFAASKPRFAELQETVVRCLNSGMIPNDLAPSDRLEAAYDMAERLSPRSVSASSPADQAQTTAQTANPARAGKSPQVSGAPSSGQSANPVRRGKVSRRASIEAALDRAGA